MLKLLAFTIALALSFVSFGQIVPNGNSGSATTNYTSGASNDPIYIWCADGLSNNTASLTANAPSGTGPFTFTWYYHDQNTFSWAAYTTQTGATSTINNLPSDGYQVQIFDASSNLVGCYIAWVWNMNSDVTASNTPQLCDATNLSGTVNVNGSFTYYNPPPAASLVTPATQISVCFDANHTYVSDLGFYLVGPASCGSPTIPLMPHPQLINASNGCCCNSGNNITDLCFTTNLVGNINPCSFTAPLSGTYSGYSSSYGDNVTINWSSLYGCSATEGDWRVQIYDCIGADVGALTNATITFSNLASVCGSPTTVNYNSGAISSSINDNSCSAGTASIFQVPLTGNFTTPININASVSYLWTSDPTVTIPGATTSLTPSLTGLSNDSFDFTLTATITYGTVVCTNFATTNFVSSCCTAVADAGGDLSYCTGFTPTIGAPATAGLTYSWSPSTGLSDASAAQPTVTALNSGSVPSTTTYTLTVTNVVDGGCTDVDDVIVTINPSPALVFTGDQEICAGECTNITVSGADFYEWAPNAAITDSSSASQNFCPSATTSYNVTGYIISSNTVTNGDFSLGAVDFSSSYILSGNTQPEGTYFVTNNANSTHPGFTGFDHTTGSGNFMVVNGSGTPGTSVWCQTITVQPNTDYVFSTWVSALALGSPAQLQFSINGTVVGDVFNAPLLTGQWEEFYTTWNSGSATSATICIVNQNTSLGGNDFGIDDINFASVCNNTETVTVTVNPLPNINAGADLTLCAGEEVTLTASNGSTYNWDNGVVNGQSFIPSVTTTYTVTGTDAEGCTNTDQVTVVLVTPPTSSFFADSLTGYPGLSVEFTNTSTDATDYFWLFGNGFSTTSTDLSGQSMVYDQPGTYGVYLIADNGYCQDSSTLQIVVIPFPDPVLHIPNVFTPNGDASNDLFFIETAYVSELELTIINRWGNFVAEILDVNGNWDGKISGKDADEGVYFYKYRAKGVNGKELTGHGNITLLR
ncbi:MAG: hypothetical protein RIT43_2470 [Bacteroidota bacterium]|jgi:gliding motility-associated-like protein